MQISLLIFMKNIITAVKPTGASMHLGNLLGAVLPFRDLAQKNNAAIFIADLHALTSVHDGEKMRKFSDEIALSYFSIFGLDTTITIFRQSDIVNITKLMWVLSNVTPYSLMLRSHSFKDSEAKNSDINMGVFNYPILMAADILGYDIDAVPVGKDQRQHLEMARDMARNFNKSFGQEIFREPEAIIVENVETIPGIDGRKMSKSYNNFIGIFDDEKVMKKRIMSIVTDSSGIDEKKNPETCNVFALLKIFADTQTLNFVRNKYYEENSGFGYGHAKTILFEAIMKYLAPFREQRKNIEAQPEMMEKRLQEGAKIMNARLDEMMKKITKVTGIY